MSFEFDTTPQRSAHMRKIKSHNTKPEQILRKALWAKGIRYRKNHPDLPGKPDIYISRFKIAIFVDGEFWHGYNWEKKKKRLKANRDYWIPKIERTMERDRKNNKKLKHEGITVLRFWASDVEKNLSDCLNVIDGQTRKNSIEAT